MSALTCCVDAAVVSANSYTFTSWKTSQLPESPPSKTTSAASDSAATDVWSPAHSSLLYRVDGWGAPYFTVNSNGNISVRPHGVNTLSHQEIDLLKVVKKASDTKTSGGLGLQFPLVIRFPDVLKNRLESLQSSFNFAIQSQKYEAHYQGVYPVKCNQDKFVVEDIVKFGSGFKFGLEAGSKPELLLAMSCLCNGSPDALLVCNGFKDVEYISLALFAKKLNLNSVIVLEQEQELDMVVEISKRLNVRPAIGVRAKLRTKHSGHFGATSGEKGKFGLTTIQLLRVVKKLKDYKMLDCLQLLHFHIGSQIPSTELLADGVGEAAQVYCELVRLGASMEVIDIGGGLGIDYDGSKSTDSDISVGYSLQEYASAVVRSVQIVCDCKGVKHPVICSESGRAIVSHHSILVFEAVSSSTSSHSYSPEISSLDFECFQEKLKDGALDYYQSLSLAAATNDYDTCLLYAEKLKERCVEQFKEGSLGMQELALVDGLCELVSKEIGVFDSVSTYHVNLSVFTSIPDFWGIGQLFPVIPIHRLSERPAVRAILSDLTCDSDGKIDKFIGGESSLPLHELEGKNGVYYLGMFLGGAYEEALGGVHNLFGGSSVVRVLQSDGPQSFAVTSAVPGASCGDVLRVMKHEPEVMFETIKERLEELIGGDNDGISGEVIVNGLACSFNNMPYLVAASNGCYCYSSGENCNADTGEEEQLSCCVGLS